MAEPGTFKDALRHSATDHAAVIAGMMETLRDLIQAGCRDVTLTVGPVEGAALARAWAALTTSAKLPSILREHWLTRVDCNEREHTDTARCYCTVWSGTPKPSVGQAVDEWVAHVLEQLTKPDSTVSTLPTGARGQPEGSAAVEGTPADGPVSSGDAAGASTPPPFRVIRDPFRGIAIQEFNSFGRYHVLEYFDDAAGVEEWCAGWEEQARGMSAALAAFKLEEAANG